jgi:hypothetical protein
LKYPTDILKIFTNKKSGGYLVRTTLLVASGALMLFASAPAFASNSDILSKLKDIQQQEQHSSTDKLQPNVNTMPSESVISTAEEIKAELGEKAKESIDQLKAVAEKSEDPEDQFKLGIAYELSGDITNAIQTIHNAIFLGPNEKVLYQELVSLYQSQKPGIISVFINGEKLDFNDGNNVVNPVIIKGSTLVPIRKITETLGAKVEWNNDTHTATIRLLNNTVQLVQDSTQSIVDGKPVTLEVPAQNINGHILVPLRFISEQFNKNVDYVPGDQETAIIPIVDKN